MPDRVLVTGASGFVGSHLLELLAGEDRELLAWHRPGREPEAVSGVVWDAVDLLDRAGVQHALARGRPTSVYHCAGAAHVGRSWEGTEETFAVNARGTHHLIEALRAIRCSARVLIPSSAMVYDAATAPLDEDSRVRPASPYALSKLAQELIGAGNLSCPEVLIARAFNHIGPRQDPAFAAAGFAKRIAEIEIGLADPVLAVGNLEARRDFTDVRDTVRAYQLILEQGIPGRVYNVCSGRAIAIADLLSMLLGLARVVIQVEVDPARYQPNDQPMLAGDPGRIRDELGWQPEIPLQRTVDELLDYWRRQVAPRPSTRHPST